MQPTETQEEFWGKKPNTDPLKNDKKGFHNYALMGWDFCSQICVLLETLSAIGHGK